MEPNHVNNAKVKQDCYPMHKHAHLYIKDYINMYSQAPLNTLDFPLWAKYDARYETCSESLWYSARRIKH